MNQEKIIEMAMNSGLPSREAAQHQLWWLEVLVKLVAQAEREACAKACDEQYYDWRAQLDRNYVDACIDCANAIKARGET